MMTDTRHSRAKITFILIATVLVVCYVYLVAPHFLTKIDALREENTQIKYDLGEIERLKGDPSGLRDDIQAAREQLAIFEKRTEVDSTNFDMDISAKAEKAKIEINKMSVEESSIIREKNVNGNVLYMQPLSVVLTGTFESGSRFMKYLENSDTGIYIIRDFLYSAGGADEASENWMISIEVFFYEKVDGQ